MDVAFGYKISRKEEIERNVWADERVILGEGFQVSVTFITNTTILSRFIPLC